MTRQEYAEYVDSVKHFAYGHGCDASTLTDDGQEGYFSWEPCYVCKRSQGGTRHDCAALSFPLPDGSREVLHPSGVCDDCIYFAVYGRLDDSTMLEIERS